MKTTFATRLKEAMKIRDIKSSQIEKISNELFAENKIKKPIKMPMITDYLKGRYEATQSNIFALALILNVNEVWLMGADVPMDRSFGRAKVAEIDVIDLNSNLVTQKIPFSYRTDIESENPSNFFAIVADDTSMFPLLDVGDIAVIKKYTSFSNFKTYLLKINGGKPIIRKIIKNDNNEIELQAINVRSYPTQTGLKFSDIEIMGEVVKAENKSAFK